MEKGPVSVDGPGNADAVALERLASIRDAWLLPLIERIAEQATTIGRLKEQIEQERQQRTEFEQQVAAESAEKDELIARLHRRIADLAEELDALETSYRHDAIDDLQTRVNALEDASSTREPARRGILRFWKR
jgi:small-conductance mechanosensitive channel